MGFVTIKCHCGKDHIDQISSGSSGWWDCKCGCSYSYANAEGQTNVHKVKECPRVEYTRDLDSRRAAYGLDADDIEALDEAKKSDRETRRRI